MHPRLAVLLVLALAAPVLAGCLQTATLDPAVAPPADSDDFPFGFTFDSTGKWSKTLTPGIHDILPVEVALVPSSDGTLIRMGIYRPDVPEGTKVPVIVDAGPYYGRGEGVVERPTDGRLANFLIENYVPKGYAVVLLPVRGTGNSGGCIELMSEAEQKDLDDMVTWLGTQEWSNGNVGLIGKSYDGTTPWMAAQFGNPHLKTIVPIAGLTSIRDLMFRNGTSEVRGPIMHNGVYWPFGFASEGRSAQNIVANLCPEAAKGLVMGPWAVASGDGASPLNYWEVRDFRPKTLENYNGSVFIIHGLQDWNVEPSMVAPFYNELQVDKKMWLGQWGHHYPDRINDAANGNDHKDGTRFDWAETLLRWFDKYLKGDENVNTGPALEVQDAQGVWRVEPANEYPPRDANWTVFHLNGKAAMAAEKGEAGTFTIAGGSAGTVAGLEDQDVPATKALFTTEALAEDMRISGTPRVHITAVPTSPGGHLFAVLQDVSPDGKVTRIGHGYMDLRFAAGDGTMKPVVPGQAVVAKMELFALEYFVPAGHSLRLQVSQENPGNVPTLDPIPSPFATPTQLKVGGDAVSEVSIPVVTRDGTAFALGWKPAVN